MSVRIGATRLGAADSFVGEPSPVLALSACARGARTQTMNESEHAALHTLSKSTYSTAQLSAIFGRDIANRRAPPTSYTTGSARVCFLGRHSWGVQLTRLAAARPAAPRSLQKFVPASKLVADEAGRPSEAFGSRASGLSSATGTGSSAPDSDIKPRSSAAKMSSLLLYFSEASPAWREHMLRIGACASRVHLPRLPKSCCRSVQRCRMSVVASRKRSRGARPRHTRARAAAAPGASRRSAVRPSRSCACSAARGMCTHCACLVRQVERESRRRMVLSKAIAAVKSSGSVVRRASLTGSLSLGRSSVRALCSVTADEQLARCARARTAMQRCSWDIYLPIRVSSRRVPAPVLAGGVARVGTGSPSPALVAQFDPLTGHGRVPRVFDARAHVCLSRRPGPGGR